METVSVKLIDLLDSLEDLLLESARIPLSGNRIVNELDVLEILDTVRKEIPNDIKNASMILNDANKYIQEAKNHASSIIDNAKSQRNQLLDKHLINNEIEAQIRNIKNQTIKESETGILRDTSRRAITFSANFG